MNTYKDSILSLSFNELQKELIENNFKKFRTKQIFNWIYKNYKFTFDEMNNIPLSLRTFLINRYDIISLKEVKSQISKNRDSQKFLFSLNDENKIESVLIESENKRNTLCISTQIGCPLDCKFCATGKMGFIRNLRVDEIVAQFLYIQSILSEKDSESKKVDNIVFMGMGEPLLNYDNLIKSIRILNDKNAVNFGIRRFTISSSGIISGIKRLIKENIDIKLAISLNSAINNKRTVIMPVNKTNPIDDVISLLKIYQKKFNKRITFEYVLLKDFNMSKKDALAVIEISKELSFNLNIIPYNPISESEYNLPNQGDIDRFLGYFNKSGIEIARRYKKGDDISAACGQLRVKNL